MAAKLLIYQMEEARMQALEGLCEALAVQSIRVDRASHRAPIGLLSGTADPKGLSAGAAGMAGREAAEAIDEEMIVMSDFTQKQFYALLDGLKEISLKIGLKAVETPYNRYWTGEMLQAELKRERQAVRG